MKKIMSLYKKYREIITYVIVGGLTTVISIATKWVLLFTILDAKSKLELQIAVIVSWIFAVAFAYFANRIFVFQSKSKDYIKEISSFVGGRVATLLMEMVIMWFFINLLGLDSDLWVAIITLVCQILIMIANYIISKFLVFIKKDN